MPTDQEAHDELVRQMKAHLGGVNPPDAGEAAVGTMRPEDRNASLGMDLSQEDAPSPTGAGAMAIEGMGHGATQPADLAASLRRGRGDRNASLGMDLSQPDRNASLGMDLSNESDPMLAKIGGKTAQGAIQKGAERNSGLEMDLTDSPDATASGMPSGPRGAMSAAVMGAAKRPPPAVPYSPPSMPQDAELKDLQDKAAADRRMGEIGKSVTAFTERPTNELDAIQQLGGVHPSARQHNSAWDNAGAEGDQAVKDLGARRASSASMAAKGEASDPNSQTAVTYRAALKKIAPDLDLSTANATQMEKIAPWLKEYAKAPNAEDSNRLSLEKDRTDLMRQKLELERERMLHPKAGKTPAAKGAPSPSARSDADTTAQGIADGRLPPPSPRQKDYQAIMSKVLAIKPDYDATTQPTYLHARENQSTNPALLSGKAVRHHMDELKSAVDDLDPGMIDSPMANRMAQGWAEGTGSDKYTRLQTAAQVVGSELSQAFQESDAAGREHVKHLVRPDQTKAQWAQSIAELEKLRDEKIGVSEKVISDLGPQKGGIQMRFPNGHVDTVPAAEVEEARKAGGQPL